MILPNVGFCKKLGNTFEVGVLVDFYMATKCFARESAVIAAPSGTVGQLGADEIGSQS